MADIAKAKPQIDRLTKAEEGWRAAPYLCSAQRPTIGYGCTSYEDGTKVKLTDPPITRARGQSLLDFKIAEGIQRTLEMVKGNASTNQLIALVVCGFNIGWEGLQGSSMIKAHNRGDYAAAFRAFGLWVKYRPNGPGTPKEDHPVLVARRGRESAIYALPDDYDDRAEAADAAPTGVPQAVEPESKLTSSPINKTSAVIVGAGTISAIDPVLSAIDAAKGVANSTSTLKEPLATVESIMTDTLGIEPSWILPIVLIGGGLYIIHWRKRQRDGGWA